MHHILELRMTIRLACLTTSNLSLIMTQLVFLSSFSNDILTSAQSGQQQEDVIRSNDIRSEVSCFNYKDDCDSQDLGNTRTSFCLHYLIRNPLCSPRIAALFVGSFDLISNYQMNFIKMITFKILSDLRVGGPMLS